MDMEEPKRTKTARMQSATLSGEMELSEAGKKLLERYAGPPPTIEVEYVLADGLKYRGVLYLVEEEKR